MFEKQPSARRQMVRGLVDDLAQVIQAIGAGRQGGFRLEAQGRHVRVALGDVGRVADEEVKALARHRGEPRAQQAAQAKAPSRN